METNQDNLLSIEEGEVAKTKRIQLSEDDVKIAVFSKDINLVLPTEILAEILRLLPLQTLKQAVLVCRLWRQLGEDPRLWAKMTLQVERLDVLYKLGKGAKKNKF